MNILTRRVVRDNETLGYEVTMDSTISYISTGGLLSKELFTSLMENGYTYFGRMEFEDSSKTNINYLPAMEYDTLSDRQAADFFDVADVMSEMELKEFTKKRQAPGEVSFEWRKPEQYLINTREELLSFIKTLNSFNASDPKTYMPLNSFTHPDALFSEEEFNDPANFWAMDAIANRRYFNLHALFMMTENLPIDGFGEINFIDAYFAWGIDGLRSTLFSKTIADIEKPLYINDNFPEKYYLSGVTYVKKDMSMWPTMPPGWTTVCKEEIIYKRASELSNFNHGLLVITKAPTTSKCIRYELETMTVELTPDAMKIITKAGDILLKTLRFLTPSNQFLPSKFWNLKNDENKDEILHILKIESLSKYLLGVMQCKSDVTSMKVYQTIGVTKPRAVDIVINIYREILFTKDGSLREEYRKFMYDDGGFDDEELQALTMQIGLIKNIYSFDDGIPENMEGLSNLCKKVEMGEININNVLSGIKADNSMRFEDIICHLDAAVKVLGLSYEEVFGIIERDAQVVSGEGSVTVTFEGKGVVNELVLHRQNFAATGFQRDLRETRNLLAKDAKHWLYVREIYSEPGQVCARHIAVRLYSWPHHEASRKASFVAAVETYIEKQILTQLNRLGVDIGDDIYKIIARCVCEFGILGRTKATFTVTDDTSITVTMKEEQCKQIHQTFERKYETTFNISNYLFKGTQPIFHCVNAIITPYWVVPLGNQLLPVCPLYYAWHYGKENETAKDYADLKTAGIIPNDSNYYSFKHLINNFSEDTQLFNSTEPGYSLIEYCMEHFSTDANKKEKPLHPMDKCYPSISYAEDEFILRDDFSNGLIHKKLYYVSLGVTNKEQNAVDVCELDYTGNLIDLYMGGKERYLESSAVSIFKGFLDDELLAFTDLDEFKAVYCAEMGSVYVKSFEQNMVFFTDGTASTSFDIPATDNSRYAVRKINDRLYLAYYESGQVLRIEL